MSALKWATAAKLIVQIASCSGILLVIRLLTPEDYGPMAKVAVVCAITSAIAELGLEAAIVRSVDMARDDPRKIYGVSLPFGAVVLSFVPGAATYVAHRGRIAADSRRSGCDCPEPLWSRDLSFRRLSKVEIASGVTSVAATLLLAWLGAGVWALVLGTLAGAIVRSAALLTLGEHAWPLFSLHGINEYR